MSFGSLDHSGRVKRKGAATPGQREVEKTSRRWTRQLLSPHRRRADQKTQSTHITTLPTPQQTQNVTQISRFPHGTCRATPFLAGIQEASRPGVARRRDFSVFIERAAGPLVSRHTFFLARAPNIFPPHPPGSTPRTRAFTQVRALSGPAGRVGRQPPSRDGPNTGRFRRLPFPSSSFRLLRPLHLPIAPPCRPRWCLVR